MKRISRGGGVEVPSSAEDATGGVLVHAPAGFGKTLLLKSFAEAKGLPYRRDWSPEPGCYDLRKPPPEVLPGQVVAARQARLPALHRLGPEDLAFTPEEVGELARRLGKRELAGPVHALFGGWPHLTRRALERGEAAWTPELRAFLEGLLPPLDLRPFLLPLPEAAFRQAGFGEAVEALLAQALAQGVPLRLLPALAGVRTPADAVHGDRHGRVRFVADRAQAHRTGREALHYLRDRLYFLDWNRRAHAVLEGKQSTNCHQTLGLVIHRVGVLLEDVVTLLSGTTMDGQVAVIQAEQCDRRKVSLHIN